MDKKVNRNAKKLNKQLREDVFKNRFEVRQLKKQRIDGIEYYLYNLIDNEQPERNKIEKWITGFSIITFNELFLLMNEFIVTSDFWSKYQKSE